MQSITTLALVAITVAITGCEAIVDRIQPHDHNGKLAPYFPRPFSEIKLTSQDEAQLARGKPVLKQIEGGGGTVVCIQDINAPKAAVWNQILDFGM
jgi:hypothetical protein